MYSGANAQQGGYGGQSAVAGNMVGGGGGYGYLKNNTNGAGGRAGGSVMTDSVGSGATGLEQRPTARDGKAMNEETHNKIHFRVAWNDGQPEHMIALIMAKCIFSAQLPKMPKEYIVRLVLDRNHRTMCLMKNRRVIGGICFRPFVKQGFAEIVFCAITSSEQIKGYGTRIMNHLKEHVKTEGIEYFLTYADNYAIGYFKKQGFTKQVSIPKDRWVGFIKDYDGGTLMQCKINQHVDYLDIPGMIQRQREVVYDKIRHISNSHTVHPGLTQFVDGQNGLQIMDIPGVREAGWKPPRVMQTYGAGANAGLRDLQAKLGAVLKSVRSLKDAYCFLKPVDTTMVADYLTIVKEPMDLSTMSTKMTRGEYQTKADFERDFMLIINNCRLYNAPDTSYYRCSQTTEKHYKALISKIKF